MKWTEKMEAALRIAVRENPTATWPEIGKIMDMPGETARCAAKRFGIRKDPATKWEARDGHYTDRRCNVEHEIANDAAAIRRHRNADRKFIAVIRQRLLAA